MTQPIVHRITTDGKERVKGPIEELLKARAESADKLQAATGMTMGQIIRALDLHKRKGTGHHGDVAAALHKLRNEGKVVPYTGPATSARGPRFVKFYRWVKKAGKAAPPSDDRRFLSMCR